ncbi:serpin-ZXA-like [Lolium rigidum]|uniref:serpin-ZXA-like n=1 Tax=Lolium rigidum TaxID=89674 RepID=UPI001F5C5E31|nr:serpin-ZXA-like [Lolium rigidum]
MADAARDGQTALALRLVKILAPVVGVATDATERNVAFSPLSVHAALALVAAGARGATQAQLLSFLGAPSAAQLAAFGRRITDTVLDDSEGTGGPRVLFGGGLWVDESRGEIKKAFRDVAVGSYKSEARTVSFIKKPEEAVEMINNCVEQATNGLIDSIISTDDIDADTDLVLANAVYFKGVWLEPFDSHRTLPGTFHRLDGSLVQAQFMSSCYLGHYYVSCMDGFKVLRLPYRPDLGAYEWNELLELREMSARNRIGRTASSADDRQYSMFVFLPDERGGLATMVDLITAAPAYLYGALPQTKPEMVLLELPKFEITFNWDVESDLGRLGLSLPFSREVGDLRGMCEKDDGCRRPTFLSKVTHTAIVKVNEEGTEAAAVSKPVRGGGGPSDIVEFKADHPFTFLIMEEGSGVIVFAGHVLDPTK